jgi:hypothetical protein
VKPLATAEAFWACGVCGAARPVPHHLVVTLRREDTWSALGDLLLGSCSSCGQRFAAAHATVLVEGDETEGHPGYLLLPVQGTPSSADVEEGRRFLSEHQMPPLMVTSLVPSARLR